MKSLPIALSVLMLVALPAWATAANAGVPIEVTAPAGDDPPNQVLELPQSCSSEDGTENPCPQKDSTTASSDPASADASSPDASATADGSLAAAPASSPDVDAAVAPADVGTAQDYQDQAQVDNTAALPNYGYPQVDPSRRMPTILVAPVSVGPFVGSAPYVPPVLPAAGPILMPRPAMVYVPRPVTPLVIGRPMIVRPMSATGMPHAFRVH